MRILDFQVNMRYLLSSILVVGSVIVGCTDSANKETKDIPDAPDFAIFYVSGHDGPLDGEPSKSYLDNPDEAGPAITKALRQFGYKIVEGYFVDDAFSIDGVGGYLALVKVLRFVDENFVEHGTRIIIVAHSHGGVWAHSAIEALSSVPIYCLVDLDVSSYGWGVTGHDLQNAYISGDPRGKYYLPYIVDDDPTSDKDPYYDVEDVIFDNVKYALEIRSGDYPPLGPEYYDEKWNVRLSGGKDGVWRKFTNTSHGEVHKGFGETISFVSQWMLSVIADDSK